MVDSVLDPSAIKRFTESKRPKPHKTNKNFAKAEFQELWKRINHKTAYTVDFSSAELIKKAIDALDRQIDIPKLTYTIRKAQQVAGNAFAAGVHESHKVDEHYTDTGVKYDLIGKVAEGTVLTRKTVRSILSGILPTHTSPIRDDAKPLQKHIYDFLATDSKGEKNFAKELDNAAGVVVYAKLPGGFAIPTPLGSYNPDWAIAFKEGLVKHVYFVAETKGDMSEMQLREIEKTKIACAKKFFVALGEKNTQYHVTYEKVASYKDLVDKVNSDNA